MDEKIRIGFLASRSDNRKSKSGPADQNLKWAGFLAILILLLGCVGMVEAQQPKKVPRIGFLTASALSVISARLESFRQGLRELGYVEGKNIVVEDRYAEEK